MSDSSHDATLRRFITLETVRETLAISDSMARSLVRSGELPAIQVGPKKVWRVEIHELESYIDRQYIATQERVRTGKA